MRHLSRRTILLGTAAAVSCMLVIGESAASPPPPGRRVALSGHDPVAYFTDGRPAKGSNEFWFAFDDAVYLFRNAEHRALFASDPERYAPQYAGFCAAGVAKGYKQEPDPEAWTIANGKLYVFHYQHRVAPITSDPTWIEKSDASWPGTRAETAIRQR
jgi:hypothetical protein